MSEIEIEFISGLRVRLVTEEEAEAAAFCVCAPLGPSAFSDNVAGTCCDCGRAIMFRPHAPKRPPKICMDCASERVKGGKA